MNEERVKVLIQYLNTLSRLAGNYHKEMAAVITLIEQEIGIGGNKLSKRLLDNHERVILEKDGLRVLGLKFDKTRSLEDNEKLLEYYKGNLDKYFAEAIR